MFFGILLVKYSPNIPPSESAEKGNLCLLAITVILLTNSLVLLLNLLKNILFDMILSVSSPQCIARGLPDSVPA